MLCTKFNSDSLKRFKKLLQRAERIVLTCHVRPDGDAIGSTLGFAWLLNSLGKRAVVVTPDLPPRSLNFLPGSREIIAFSKYPDFAERIVKEADLILCCDFNKLSRLDAFEPIIAESTAPKVLIDHHQDPGDFSEIKFVFEDMSSTCELVFRLICALGYYQDLSIEGATCLTTGLITDTRNFSVNCSDPEIYTVLIRLLEKGVDKPFIVRQALELRSLDSFKLQTYALANNLEIFDKYRTAIITIDREELSKFHYQKGDTEGLVNMPLTIDGISASYFLREDEDCIKISARSVGEFPVSKVCEDLFSGGGHLQAAGGEFHGSIEECRQILIDSLKNYEAYLPEGNV